MKYVFGNVSKTATFALTIGLALVVMLSKPALAAPDLVITSLSANVNHYAVTYTAQVKNNGTETSTPASIDIFRNVQPGSTTPAGGYPTGTVGALTPGGTTTVQFPVVYYQNGNYTVYALIDSRDVVSETVENNNTFGPTSVKVAATPSAGSDLMITGITVVTQDDGSLKYDVTVFNGGSEAVAGAPIGSGGKVARLQIFFDSETAPAFLIPKGDSNFDFFDGIAAGATKTIKFYWNAPPAKLSWTWCLIDSGQAISESNENNNVYGPLPIDLGVDIPVSDPDLVIENFEATVQGMSVSYQIDIRNVGEKTTNAFTVAVVHSSDTQPAFSAVAPDAKASLFVGNGLAPGDSQTIKLFWPQAPVGSHKAWAMVDSTNAVVESNEDNNVAGPDAFTIITITGPDLIITEFKADVLEDTVIYTGFVKNVGDQTTGSFDVDLVVDSKTPPSQITHGDQFKTLPGLNPGASVSVSFTWNDVADGTYSSWIAADTFNAIQESSEANNISGPYTVTVGQDDPVDPPITNDDNCKDAAFIQSPCKCGALTVQSGYCCEFEWRVLPCDIVIDEPDLGQDPVETDLGTADNTDLSGPDVSGGIDPTLISDSSDDDDDEGCAAHPASHNGPSAIVWLLLFVTFTLIARRAHTSTTVR